MSANKTNLLARRGCLEGERQVPPDPRFASVEGTVSRVIIDSNALQSPQLDAFLSQSTTNYAVLADYVAMEAYKGNTFVSIFKSMEILARYPKQVVVLKSTCEVTRFSAKRRVLQEHFIDLTQTSEFPQFCTLLQMARHGDHALQEQIAEHGRVATQHMNLMLPDAATLAPVLRELEQNFTPEELRIIRLKAPFTETLIDKTENLIVEMTSASIRLHPNPPKGLKDFDDLFGTYLFHHSVCNYVWVLDWIGRGGADNVLADRMRNDVVDVILAAYGTVFDGVMSADKKLKRIYDEASLILDFMTKA